MWPTLARCPRQRPSIANEDRVNNLSCGSQNSPPSRLTRRRYLSTYSCVHNTTLLSDGVHGLQVVYDTNLSASTHYHGTWYHYHGTNRNTWTNVPARDTCAYTIAIRTMVLEYGPYQPEQSRAVTGRRSLCTEFFKTPRPYPRSCKTEHKQIDQSHKATKQTSLINNEKQHFNILTF
jgi:hypothetical protein